MTSSEKPPAPIVDPDRLMTVIECVEVFGLTESAWRTAIREDKIPFARSSTKGGNRIKASDARAFVNAWHERNLRP